MHVLQEVIPSRAAGSGAFLNENLQRMMAAGEQNYFRAIKALVNAEEKRTPI